MSLWIFVTLIAAFMQNLRFMLQRHLKTTSLSTVGATYSRFLFSLPLIIVMVSVYLYATGYSFPNLNARFWAFALVGGVSQILATAFVVALFAERNFTAGIALKKSEVILTAIVGLLVLGEAVTAMGLLAIAIGFAGVILLSDPPKTDAKLRWSERLFNKASGFGLGSGLLFGFSAIGYRGATLEIASDDPFLRAMATLAVVIAWQVLVMTVYMMWRERDEIGRVVASWRVSSLIGVTSMFGSLGWFIAFTLQNAAYVKALGQVELIFTFLGSYFVFNERSPPREVLGILLIVASILCLVVSL